MALKQTSVTFLCKTTNHISLRYTRNNWIHILWHRIFEELIFLLFFHNPTHHDKTQGLWQLQLSFYVPNWTRCDIDEGPLNARNRHLINCWQVTRSVDCHSYKNANPLALYPTILPLHDKFCFNGYSNIYNPHLSWEANLKSMKASDVAGNWCKLNDHIHFLWRLSLNLSIQSITIRLSMQSCSIKIEVYFCYLTRYYHLTKFMELISRTTTSSEPNLNETWRHKSTSTVIGMLQKGY